MRVKFINTLESVRKYVEAAEESNEDLDELWNEYLIKPYWKEISQWAPFDCSFMKPSPVKDIQKLKKQLAEFQKLNLEYLENEFLRISSTLVKQDDDEIIIAIYLLDDNISVVKERQNDVIGACVSGNIVISINPFD